MSFTWRFKIALIPALLSCLAIAKDVPLGGKTPPPGFFGDNRVLKDIPEFVLDHAPLVHLYSKEPFWPSDIGEHLKHTTPFLNWTKIEPGNGRTVDDVGELNQYDKGRWVYLKSNDEIDLWRDKYIKNLPAWLTSARNKPASLELNGNKMAAGTASANVMIQESDRDKWFDVGPPTFSPEAEEHAREFTVFGRKQRRAIQVPKSPPLPGRSSAPAVLLVVEKDEGVVDAFWFYFYSYNLGNSVFTFRFGNHVGDWEHSVVRFHHGVPKAVFLSQHAGGAVYTYDAVEKRGKRVSISLLLKGMEFKAMEYFVVFNGLFQSISSF
jgi:hypothetical protein